jgi:hypothetical protein
VVSKREVMGTVSYGSSYVKVEVVCRCPQGGDSLVIIEEVWCLETRDI